MKETTKQSLSLLTIIVFTFIVYFIVGLEGHSRGTTLIVTILFFGVVFTNLMMTILFKKLIAHNEDCTKSENGNKNYKN